MQKSYKSDSSAKYYQDNKERLQKEVKEKKSDNMVVNDVKTSLNIKNKF